MGLTFYVQLNRGSNVLENGYMWYVHTMELCTFVRTNEHIYLEMTLQYWIFWFKLLEEPLRYTKYNTLHNIVGSLFSLWALSTRSQLLVSKADNRLVVVT